MLFILWMKWDGNWILVNVMDRVKFEQQVMFCLCQSLGHACVATFAMFLYAMFPQEGCLALLILIDP